MKTTHAIVLGSLLAFSACEEHNLREPGALVPKTVDQDQALPSISVNGTLLHSESFGNSANPMIVVLHGGPGGDYRYLLNCKAFADQGYYVVFFDQRGSGLSRREGKTAYSMQVMLDDLSGVIQHYKNSPQQKIILLGQSWGAMLATAYINLYPAAISGAILCEPGGFVWKDVKDYISRSRSYGITSETLNDVTYVDQFITGKDSEQEILDYKFALSAGKTGTEDDPTGDRGNVPFWRLGAVVNQTMLDLGERDQPDWTNYLNTFGTEVLFIYSERNKAYGQSYAQHVSSAYPNVRLERIDGAGHDMITFPAGWNNFFPIALEYLNALK